jgi:hypothetical protein
VDVGDEDSDVNGRDKDDVGTVEEGLLSIGGVFQVGLCFSGCGDDRELRV